MWRIVQELIPIVLVILLVSQLILPMIMNQRTWWLFRKPRKVVVEDPESLTSEVEKTKIIVNETKDKVNKVREKVDYNYKSAEELKQETDKLI